MLIRIWSESPPILSIYVEELPPALSRQLNLAVRNLQFPVPGSCRGHGSPSPERFVSEDAERGASGEMALDVECVVDSRLNRQQALRHCHINRFYWSVLTHWQEPVSIKSTG
jgi:hypothetical protein